MSKHLNNFIPSIQHIKMKVEPLFVCLLLIFQNSFGFSCQTQETSPPDVLAYEVRLEPFLAEAYIEGYVVIKFRIAPGAKEVAFDSGGLTVTKLEGDHVLGFKQKEKQTVLALAHHDTDIYEVKLFYSGHPDKGLIFMEQSKQAYTVYFTSEWMIGNMAASDKATLILDLIIPEEVSCVANGALKSTTAADGKVKYTWVQDYETPAYTYGFAIGAFEEADAYFEDIRLDYRSEGYAAEEMKKIFQYTGDMMSFFEEKSGVEYPQGVYTQVLIGHHYQEMSGFSVLKQSYGDLVLKDSTETNLISHELAHQWWGNRLTCKDWNHFWLNEGFATFMSAAYNEHRFGAKKYQENIDAYFRVYSEIKAKGNDKPLVFPDWINPTRDDRNLVYFKGAYVLHLLKVKLGDELFWKGIKDYTQTYIGQSVATQDFQLSLEKTTGQSLDTFFEEWVY